MARCWRSSAPGVGSPIDLSHRSEHTTAGESPIWRDGRADRLVQRPFLKPDLLVMQKIGGNRGIAQGQILDADIFLLCAPIWVGHMSSLGQRVFERLDADLSSTDDDGRPIMYNKVALTAVVGNEDGAHHVTAEMHQGLNDIGFTVAAQGGVYWVGEAMQTVDFKDLDQVPDPVASTISSMSVNAVHLAKSLKASPYPAP